MILGAIAGADPNSGVLVAVAPNTGLVVAGEG